MTALCEGGIIKACTEPQMVTLVANTRGKPALTICGIITEPMAEVSATEEPEMQPNKVEAMMLTKAKPPRMKMDQILEIKGILDLNASDVEEMSFIIRNATII